MNLSQIVRDLREELLQRLQIALLDLFSYTKMSKPSKNGRDDQVEGRQDDEKANSDSQRVQHYGFRSVPPVGTWVLRAKIGSQNFTLGEDSTKYAPTDLEEGEATLFNSQSGVRVKLTKDGDVLIDAKDGQKVKLASAGGGTQPINRRGDGVNMGQWSHTPASGVGVTPCQLTFAPPGGPLQIITTPVGLSGVTKDGSTKVESG